MKKSFYFTLLLVFILFIGFFLVDLVFDESRSQKVEAESQVFTSSDVASYSFQSKPKSRVGKLTIKVVTEQHSYPLANLNLVFSSSALKDALLVTDEKGIVSSPIIKLGETYQITPVNTPAPFVFSENQLSIKMNDRNQKMLIKATLPEHIKKIEFGENGSFVTTEVDIPVETLMQKPELPNGCEITSLTAVLNYLGYSVTKETMTTDFLPMRPFTRKNGKLYGADPYLAFAGDPSKTSGFFVYAPPIVKAADSYFLKKKSSMRAQDISNSSHKDILAYLNKGIPVVIWVTLDLSKPKITYSWYLYETGKKFNAPVNLHAVVLKGYDEHHVYVMDPLKGQVKHKRELFFKSYDELGKHAMVVKVN